ncbi:MAG: hypothetical protein AAGJ10_18395 [Bacteroidota bacterium]
MCESEALVDGPSSPVSPMSRLVPMAGDSLYLLMSAGDIEASLK